MTETAREETSSTETVGDHEMRRSRIKRRRAGWRNSDILRTTTLVIGFYLAIRLVWFANPLFLTAFLGILFGLAVSSGVDFLARWRWPRGVSAAAIVIGFFALLFGFGAWMAPTIHTQGVELRQRLPDAMDRFESWINKRRNGIIGMMVSGFSNDSAANAPNTSVAPVPSPPATRADSVVPAPGVAAADSTALSATLRQRMSSQLSGATRYLFPFLSSTIAAVTGLFIVVFLSIYIAVDPEMYRRGIMHLFPHRRRERIGEVLSAVAAVLRRWLITQLIAMLAISIVTTIVLLILRVKAAFALGLLSGLFEFIPTVGPIISALPAIAMGFLDSPEKAVYVAIAFVAVQFMENHLLIPLLMKGGVNLPPALTVFTQALMALLFGFLGLMCAVPLLAASMTAVKMLYVEDVVGDPQIGAEEDPQKGVEA